MQYPRVGLEVSKQGIQRKVVLAEGVQQQLEKVEGRMRVIPHATQQPGEWTPSVKAGADRSSRLAPGALDT